jgi:hypothetical protein
VHRGLEATRTRTQSWFMLKISDRLCWVAFDHEFDIDQVELPKAFRGAARKLEIKCVTLVRCPLALALVVMSAANVL